MDYGVFDVFVSTTDPDGNVGRSEVAISMGAKVTTVLVAGDG